jgi:hypothetical protein
MQWLTDDNGNKCSVEYFGSKEAAQNALDSLKDCRNCTNCSFCFGCSGCSRCSDLQNAHPVEAKASDVGKFGPPPVPIIPDIHKAVYEASSHPGSLAMDSVHTCENTHCRGGWVITLAGEAGRKLEYFFDWNLAARMIYEASDPGFKIHPARFFDNNADALADMKALAEKQPLAPALRRRSNTEV